TDALLLTPVTSYHQVLATPSPTVIPVEPGDELFLRASVNTPVQSAQLQLVATSGSCDTVTYPANSTADQLISFQVPAPLAACTYELHLAQVMDIAGNVADTLDLGMAVQVEASEIHVATLQLSRVLSDGGAQTTNIFSTQPDFNQVLATYQLN